MTAIGGDIWILGSGGHGVVVRALVEACGGRVLGFAGDGPPGDAARGHPFVSVDDLPADARIALAIGDNAPRRAAGERLEAGGWSLASLVHPRATLETSVVVGPGAAVCLGAVLAAGVELGTGAIVNSGAVVDHECRVGVFAHVAPGARLAGRVVVGDGAFVGIGATIIQGVRIGVDAVVGAGAVVLEDVAEGARVAGVPARPIV
ncbi:MAG: acetyltransferase [Planctomycetota bacterium]